MHTLETYGWNEALAKDWQEIACEHPMLAPARVIADFGTSLRVVTPEEMTAELSGKLAHYTDREHVPKVGDWVGIRVTDNTVVIETVLPRIGEIARATTGKATTKQIIATNVDLAFILLALDHDFNVDRLRRYLYQLSIHGIEPVVVLNKADKTTTLPNYLSQLQPFNVPVIITTAKDGKGVETIKDRITDGRTAILLGSSGVGKSTLTNVLLEEIRQKTQEIRERDRKGKHTTVHRELFVLPSGGMLIDTPGMREIKLWGTENTLEENFDDVIRIIASCKYSSCQHHGEEGCAVQATLRDGTLSPNHYLAYVKLKGELSQLKTRKIDKLKADSKKAKRQAIAKHQKKRRYDEE